MKLKQKLIHKHRLKALAALLLADLTVFGFISPVHASAIWLIIGYILLGTTLLMGAACSAEVLKTYGDRVYAVAWRFLRYATIGLIGVIGLQSIGQLTTKDMAILLPLLAVGYWYIGYNKQLVKQAAP